MNINQCILTYTGNYVSMTPPFGILDFHVSDIAHALSQLCRFGGHTRQFYSVAQHSVLVSHIVRVEYRLQALLHDAAEAYCGDIMSPLKNLPAMAPYREHERVLQSRLFDAFGVIRTEESTAAVKAADLQMLATERRDLMAPNNAQWPILDGILPRQSSIAPLMPAAAETQFMKRFKELSGVL
jgi:5'-deoxynucleotidase YfbR-like HD superfamily hydrolase